MANPITEMFEIARSVGNFLARPDGECTWAQMLGKYFAWLVIGAALMTAAFYAAPAIAGVALAFGAYSIIAGAVAGVGMGMLLTACREIALDGLNKAASKPIQSTFKAVIGAILAAPLFMVFGVFKAAGFVGSIALSAGTMAVSGLLTPWFVRWGLHQLMPGLAANEKDKATRARFNERKQSDEHSGPESHTSSDAKQFEALLKAGGDHEQAKSLYMKMVRASDKSRSAHQSLFTPMHPRERVSWDDCLDAVLKRGDVAMLRDVLLMDQPDDAPMNYQPMLDGQAHYKSAEGVPLFVRAVELTPPDKRLAMLQMLREKGANPLATVNNFSPDSRSHGYGALHYALRDGDKASIDFLLEQMQAAGKKGDEAARASARHDSRHYTGDKYKEAIRDAVLATIKNGDADTLAAFIDHEVIMADYAFERQGSSTPLIVKLACQSLYDAISPKGGEAERAAMLRVLLERGAKVSTLESIHGGLDQRSALFEAACHSTAAVTVLLAHGADVDQQCGGSQKQTALERVQYWLAEEDGGAYDLQVLQANKELLEAAAKGQRPDPKQLDASPSAGFASAGLDMSSGRRPNEGGGPADGADLVSGDLDRP